MRGFWLGGGNVANVEMLPAPIPIPNWKLATLELATLATFPRPAGRGNQDKSSFAVNPCRFKMYGKFPTVGNLAVKMIPGGGGARGR